MNANIPLNPNMSPMDILLRSILGWIQTELKSLMTYQARSAWFESEKMQVYLRIYNQHYLVGGVVPLLVVSNVEVHPQYQGEGIYSDFLKRLEDLPIDGIMIENVLDLAQIPLYERRKYHRMAFKDARDAHMIKLLKLPEHLEKASKEIDYWLETSDSEEFVETYKKLETGEGLTVDEFLKTPIMANKLE